MNAVLPMWVEWVRALSVPAIAFAGVTVAAANLRLGRLKRLDDLYDRRLSLLQDILDYVDDPGGEKDPLGNDVRRFQGPSGGSSSRIRGLFNRLYLLFNEAFAIRIQQIYLDEVNKALKRGRDLTFDERRDLNRVLLEEFSRKMR